MVNALARIDNTRPTYIDLPSVGGFPEIKLAPGGGKAVPQGYIDALGTTAPPGVIGLWKALLDKGWLKVTQASDPAIKAALAKPEMPAPPPSLEGLGEKGAMLVVDQEDSVATLRNWFSSERRPEVRAAIHNRIKALGDALLA
jgi:hypothetical protein